MNKPTGEVKELRKFAVILFFALGIIGIALVRRDHPTAILFCGLGWAALLVAWLLPAVLRPVYKYWMKLALVLGLISSHIILALLYYLLFTPIGFVMRLTGKTPLALQLDKKKNSYWVRREDGERDKQRYEKMF